MDLKNLVVELWTSSVPPGASNFSGALINSVLFDNEPVVLIGHKLEGIEYFLLSGSYGNLTNATITVTPVGGVTMINDVLSVNLGSNVSFSASVVERFIYDNVVVDTERSIYMPLNASQGCGVFYQVNFGAPAVGGETLYVRYRLWWVRQKEFKIFSKRKGVALY